MQLQGFLEQKVLYNEGCDLYLLSSFFFSFLLFSCFSFFLSLFFFLRFSDVDDPEEEAIARSS